MKEKLLILLFFISSDSIGQTIQSITTLPVNPTEQDSVFVLAHCIFTSSPCDQHTSGYGISGNGFSAWALNCVGPLTAICYYTDTFSLGILPAGTYLFNFHLDQGFGETVCTPGIVAGPDSLFSFTVLPNTSSNDNESAKNIFSVYPNPVSDNLEIQFNQKVKETEANVSLVNIYGVKIFEENIFPEKGEILLDVKRVKAGIYFLQLTANNFNSLQKMIKQ